MVPGLSCETGQQTGWHQQMQGRLYVVSQHRKLVLSAVRIPPGNKPSISGPGVPCSIDSFAWCQSRESNHRTEARPAGGSSSQSPWSRQPWWGRWDQHTSQKTCLVTQTYPLGGIFSSRKQVSPCQPGPPREREDPGKIQQGPL